MTSKGGDVQQYTVSVSVTGAPKIVERKTSFWGSAKITSISERGLVTIKFNESMQVPQNLSIFNNETVDIYVQPSTSALIDITFNASKQNLTWTVETFDKMNMTIQLKFENPLYISTKLE